MERESLSMSSSSRSTAPRHKSTVYGRVSVPLQKRSYLAVILFFNARSSTVSTDLPILRTC